MGSCLICNSKKHKEINQINSLENAKYFEAYKKTENYTNIEPVKNVKKENDQPIQKQLKSSHKKKNLTSFNLTDCDINYTNHNEASPYLLRNSINKIQMTEPGQILKKSRKLDLQSFSISHKIEKNKIRVISHENFAIIKQNLDEFVNEKNIKFFDFKTPNKTEENNLKITENSDVKYRNTGGDDQIHHKAYVNDYFSYKNNKIPFKNISNNVRQRIISNNFSNFSKSISSNYYLNDPLIQRNNNEINYPINKSYQKKNIESVFHSNSEENNINISVISLESIEKEKENIYNDPVIILKNKIEKEYNYNCYENNELKENKKILSDSEKQLLQHYSRIWHHLSNAYREKKYYNESLNCLLSAISIYKLLELSKFLLVSLMDLLLLSLMIENNENLEKNIIFTEKLESSLQNDFSFKEIKPFIFLIKMGISIKEKKWVNGQEYLKMFIILQMEEYCEDIIKNDEISDIMLFLNREGKIIKAKNESLKFLESKKDNERIDGLIELIYERTLSFKNKIISLWNCIYLLRIPEKIKPISNLLLKMGNLLRLILDLPNHAIYFYDSAYKQDSNCIKALFFTALAYRSLGKSDSSVEYYKLALEKNPNFTDCYFNLANIFLEDFSNIHESENLYKKALFSLKNNKEIPLVSIGRIFNLLSEISFQKKDFIKAILLNSKGIFTDFLFEENYSDLSKNIENFEKINPIFKDYFKNMSILLNFKDSENTNFDLTKSIKYITEKGEQKLENSLKNWEKIEIDDHNYNIFEKECEKYKNYDFNSFFLFLTSKNINDLDEFCTFVSSQENSTSEEYNKLSGQLMKILRFL